MIYGKPHKLVNGEWIPCSQEEFEQKKAMRHDAITEQKQKRNLEESGTASTDEGAEEVTSPESISKRELKKQQKAEKKAAKEQAKLAKKEAKAARKAEKAKGKQPPTQAEAETPELDAETAEVEPVAEIDIDPQDNTQDQGTGEEVCEDA